MSDAEEFLGLSSARIPPRSSEFGKRQKLYMVLLSWALGLLIASPDPRSVLTIPLFPYGLAGLVSHWVGASGGGRTELQWLGLGWALYLALTTAALVAGRRRRFYVWWTILTVLLILNGAGCRAMLEGLDGLR